MTLQELRTYTIYILSGLSLDCAFKLNCVMISLNVWRESGEVWPSKNKHAPDGEKDRAGAASGLASVTAPGAL